MTASFGLPTSSSARRTGDQSVALCTLYLILLFVAANQALTQYLASLFHYHASLGQPWFAHVYAPWAWRGWPLLSSGAHRGTVVLAYAITFLAFGALAFGGLYGVALAGRRIKAVANLHGSARWATRDEIAASGLLPASGQPGAGVYVGAVSSPDGAVHYLRHNGPEHILAFAPTRSGKGVALIVPTLLSWKESAVVYDLKGENWALTSGWRKSAGHAVLRFDPMDTTGTSSRFNPLAEVRLGTAHEVADVQNIVTMLVDPEGKGLADHWDKTSFMFLSGVVLHALYEGRDRGTPTTLPQVAALLSPPGGIDALYAAMAANTWLNGQPHPTVAQAALDMLEKDPRERSSVLSSVKTCFAIYTDPVLAANVAHSDFRLSQLMQHDRPVSLYLVIDPPNKERLRPLVRLLLTQIVRALTPRIELAGAATVGAPRRRLLLLIDEFPTLGRLPVVQDALAYVAGYGIKAYLIAQDIAQLTAAYGPSEAITANCHIKVAFAPNRLETAEALSKMTGTTTVVKRVIGKSGQRMGTSLGQVNESVQEFARPLLTADECMRLPSARKNPATGEIEAPGDMLIFVAGMSPIYGRQPLYFKDPVFARRARLAPPAASDRLHLEPVSLG